MSEFRRVALGDVVRHDVFAVEVADGANYPIVGVLNRGRGLLQREPITAAQTKYAKLNVVREGQLVYSKLKAFEGAVTVATGLHDGLAYASPEFPTFTCDAALLPQYMRLVTCLPSFWDDLARLSTGIGGRRERVAPRDLLSIEVSLPPRRVQRRIVDLVRALDANIAALDVESEAARAAYGAVAEAVIGRGPELAVAQLAVGPRGLVGGPFGSLLTTKDYVDSGVPVIRGGNMPKVGWTIGGEFVYVSQEKASRLAGNQAVSDDVIFTQRGTVGQVGLVPSGGPATYIVSQSQMRLRANPELVLPQYVFHSFSRPSVVANLKANGQATANPHINLGLLARSTLPVPCLTEQARIIEVLDASLTHAERLFGEATTLAKLRASLLPALLSGQLEVPESYDELVGAL